MQAKSLSPQCVLIETCVLSSLQVEYVYGNHVNNYFHRTLVKGA